MLTVVPATSRLLIVDFFNPGLTADHSRGAQVLR